MLTSKFPNLAEKHVVALAPVESISLARILRVQQEV